jgi:hypothetical protein
MLRSNFLLRRRERGKDSNEGEQQQRCLKKSEPSNDFPEPPRVIGFSPWVSHSTSRPRWGRREGLDLARWPSHLPPLAKFSAKSGISLRGFLKKPPAFSDLAQPEPNYKSTGV